LAKVFDVAHRNNGNIQGVTSSIVLIALWPMELDSDGARRAALVAALRREMPDSVKIAHGRREYLRGNVGSNRRIVFGHFFTNVGASLAALQRADVIELS
jgi:hypothetical protein